VQEQDEDWQRPEWQAGGNGRGSKQSCEEEHQKQERLEDEQSSQVERLVQGGGGSR